MNKTFKIIERHPDNGLQTRKRIYTSEQDYLKYGEETFKRYSEYYIAELWELVDGKWVKIKFELPRKPWGYSWKQ